MAKFWDKLLDIKSSLAEEIVKIEGLLSIENYKAEYSLYSLIKRYFLSWEFRRNLIDFDTFLQKTGLDLILQRASLGLTTTNEYLDYAEFIINILPVTLKHSKMYEVASCYRSVMRKPDTLNGHTFGISYVNPILQNIFNTLEDLTHKIVEVDGRYYVVAKDAIVLDVATKLSEVQSSLSNDILCYGHRNNANNLKEKGAILARFYKYYESKLKKWLKSKNHSKLCSTIGDLANNIPEIRHGVTNGAFTDLADDKKEELMDKLFSLYLGAIEIKECNKIIKEISESIKN